MLPTREQVKAAIASDELDLWVWINVFNRHEHEAGTFDKTRCRICGVTWMNHLSPEPYSLTTSTALPVWEWLCSHFEQVHLSKLEKDLYEVRCGNYKHGFATEYHAVTAPTAALAICKAPLIALLNRAEIKEERYEVAGRLQSR